VSGFATKTRVNSGLLHIPHYEALSSVYKLKRAYCAYRIRDVSQTWLASIACFAGMEPLAQLLSVLLLVVLSGVPAQSQCPAGQYVQNGVCTTCPAGQVVLCTENATLFLFPAKRLPLGVQQHSSSSCK